MNNRIQAAGPVVLLLMALTVAGCGGGGGTGDGGKAATTTLLQASASAVAAGTAVTFTATVARATGTAIPTGTVTFLDGSATLGTGALDGAGVATCVTSALAGGAHPVTASYGGDSASAGSTSTAVTVTVTATVAHGQWTWMGGSKGALASPVFGPKGTAGVSYRPGARLQGGAWTGQDGSFWLFGGQIDDVNGGGGYGNDLWRYDSRHGTWTWASGTTQRGQAGIYGTSADAPGSRIWPTTWVGADGGLWLFGGVAYDAGGHLNPIADLWKYDVGLGTWTWRSGSSSCCGPTPATSPASNVGAVGWTDGSGDLWLFGGHAQIVNADATSGTGSDVNELWRFSASEGGWALVGGTRFTFTTPAPACTNTGTGGMPGPRNTAVRWTDPSGNFWLFGGWCTAGASAVSLDDLWTFEPGLLRWTLVSGASAPDARGSYGTRGTPAAGNHPGARKSAVGWADAGGDLWLLGGYGYGAAGGAGALNDLWRFSPASGRWTWVSGSDQVDPAGTYGTPGVAAAANVPAATFDAQAWSGVDGSFWLFGGDDGDDLWVYAP